MTLLDVTLTRSLVAATLAQGDRAELEIISGSMSPLLLTGDSVLVEVCPWETLQAGDIIVVAAADMLVTHRFCRHYHEGDSHWLIMRGDRRMGYDQPIKVAQYVGKVTTRKRGDHLLSLVQGRGRWLSLHLDGVARLEAKLFRTEAAAIRPGMNGTALLIGRSWHNHFLTRQIIHAVRLPLFIWATALTKGVR